MARQARPHGRSRAPEPVRITTAPTNAADEIAGRQRRYLVSMGLRVVCFVGAIVAWPHWFAWVLVAGAVLLPYVAVVLANARGSRDDGLGLRAASARSRELGPGEAGRQPS